MSLPTMNNAPLLFHGTREEREEIEKLRKQQMMAEFDKNWESSSEEEDANDSGEDRHIAQSPSATVVMKQPPKKKAPPKAVVRADPRNRDTFVPIRGKQIQQFNEWQQEQTGEPRDERTHMSSEDFALRQGNPQWNAKRYEGTNAISSDDLFQEEKTTGDLLLDGLRTIKYKVKETFEDLGNE